jgi:hypothetical protein
VFLYSARQGRLDKENLHFTTESYLTGVYPQTGSNLGGTLVTITGVNFSDDKLDNSVIIGDSACLIESASSTEIVCEIEKREPCQDCTDGEDAQVSVMLKLAETAKACDTCSFTYVEPTAKVDNLAVAYVRD